MFNIDNVRRFCYNTREKEIKMKSLYYQFVNFIQTMDQLWFIILWLGMFAVTLVLVMKFFKIYNGTQKKFEKLSLLVLALIVFAALIFLTYLRK